MKWYCAKCKKIHSDDEMCPYVQNQLKTHPQWPNTSVYFRLRGYLNYQLYNMQNDEGMENIKMKTIEMIYDPYKMRTKMFINGVDVCQNPSYDKFKEFIENEIPLQTWIEPIGYLNWAGFVNEVSDPEINDEVKVVFSGRVIDFEDLKRSIADQNEERSKETRVIYHFQHKKVLDDKVLAQNIEEVVKELKSDRFRELVAQRTTKGLTEKYEKLDENYKTAKENLFYIVLAGMYNSGKSTLFNTLIRHDILPTSSNTCTSKNCRIRHDSSMGTKVSLTCYDENDKIVIDKRVFDNDMDCANAFREVCPINVKDDEDKYPTVNTMELAVDLSHLYPASVNEDKFTIVLVDTPGMDSGLSKRHAEIALEAITMDSKPMIILCASAGSYENITIGGFLKKIVAQSKEEGSGFNDRFLFLMNMSDNIIYNTPGYTAETAKRQFADYLTDSSRWSIEENEHGLKELAEEASHFVPRVFMTTGLIAFAIQCKAYDFSDEELDDPYKEDLNDKLKKFGDKICNKKRENYYLARYCDIPNYRKDELEREFQAALNEHDDIRATQIQCGIMSVELAIKDYIERYAYPIKVRGLLNTFEDILEDVEGFTNGVLDELKQAEKELGERSSERKEASERKRGVEEKIAALEKAKRKIEEQLKSLEDIKFDSESLRKTTGEFRADIEDDREIVFIRQNPRVHTGQKSHIEVENEISRRISNIKNLFERTLRKTNKKLEEIKAKHDSQILDIFGYLKSAVVELENSGVFSQGEYKFTDSVLWKMNFANINSEKFASDMRKNVVDKSIKTEKIRNYKKDEWRSSWNPFKKIGSWFMDDYKTVTKTIDGYYETTELRKSIDGYLLNLQRESGNMEKTFMKILEDSKKKVHELIEKLLQELRSFLADIQTQEERIERLGNSISKLNKEIKANEETRKWLEELKEKIKGE